MKKKTLFMFIGVLLLVALVPFYSGYRYKSELDAFIEELAYAGIKVENIRYETGWWESVIDSKFSLEGIPQIKPAVGVPDFPEIVMKTIVHHGPYYDSEEETWLFLRADSTFWVNGEPVYPDDVEPVVRVRLGLNSDGLVIIDAPPIFKSQGNDSVDFKGFIAIYDTHPDGFDGQFRYQMPEMIYEGNGVQVNVSGVEGTLNLHRSPAGLLLSDGVFGIKRVGVSAASGADYFVLKQFENISESSVEQDILGGSSTTTIKKVKIGKSEYDNVYARLLLGGINDTYLSNFSEGIRDAYKAAGGDNQELAVQMKKLFEIKGWRILTGKPYLTLEKFTIGAAPAPIDARLFLQLNDLDEDKIKSGNILQSVGLEFDLASIKEHAACRAQRASLARPPSERDSKQS